MMKEKQIEALLNEIKADRELADQARSRIVTAMLATAHQESDRLEHHLLEMPLSVVIYQWIIVRLKARPWRFLIPASLALSWLLQGVLTRVNLLQLLSH